MKLPVDVNTERIAFGLVLVASMVNVPGERHCAFLIATRSAAGGAPGETVTEVFAVLPTQVAVRLTVVRWATVVVFTWNVPLAVP